MGSIIPQFRADDFPGGIARGVEAIIKGALAADISTSYRRREPTGPAATRHKDNYTIMRRRCQYQSDTQRCYRKAMQSALKEVPNGPADELWQAYKGHLTSELHDPGTLDDDARRVPVSGAQPKWKDALLWVRRRISSMANAPLV
jgi:hypothetical protein